MNTEVEIILRLLLAAALGAGIGYQRERANKPAGLRTHVLISLGSALFTVVSIFGFGGGVDTARVAAGVVTGIGFIGAGVIFRGIHGVYRVGSWYRYVFNCHRRCRHHRARADDSQGKRLI
jgi:putative Mg2+ transporter-C (MgtC) family protein